jgi:hypothetical protein
MRSLYGKPLPHSTVGLRRLSSRSPSGHVGPSPSVPSHRGPLRTWSSLNICLIRDHCRKYVVLSSESKIRCFKRRFCSGGKMATYAEERGRERSDGVTLKTRAATAVKLFLSGLHINDA